MKPIVVWLTGLPSSGKSTISKELSTLLRSGIRVAQIDGDELRKTINSDLGYGYKDRIENHRRAAELCNMFINHVDAVIVSMVTGSPVLVDTVVKNIRTNTLQLVHVDTPLDVCIERDVKGLYKLKPQTFVAMCAGFSAPTYPHIKAQTDKPVYETAKQIYMSLCLSW